MTDKDKLLYITAILTITQEIDRLDRHMKFLGTSEMNIQAIERTAKKINDLTMAQHELKMLLKSGDSLGMEQAMDALEKYTLS